MITRSGNFYPDPLPAVPDVVLTSNTGRKEPEEDKDKPEVERSADELKKIENKQQIEKEPKILKEKYLVVREYQPRITYPERLKDDQTEK